MKKIPTLFRRDPENMRHVLPEITPSCEWVLQGDGNALRKYDGTCCMYDGKHWWARREVKPGKQPPENFQPVETDETTGKTMGWEPIEQSPFAKFHAEAINDDDDFSAGTYELCGPKVQGNPENFDQHVLIKHSEAEFISDLIQTPSNQPKRTYEELSSKLREMSYEGVVWHHSDGRMCKLKRRDFV